MKVITTTSTQSRKNRWVLHISRMAQSVLFGIILFFVTAIVRPVVEQTVMQTPQPLPLTVQDIDTSIDSAQLLTLINTKRATVQKPAFILKDELCASVNSALERVKNNEALGEFIALCPTCAHLTMLSLEGTYDEQTLFDKLLSTNSEQMLSDDISTCIQSSGNTVVIGIGTLTTQIPKSQRATVSLTPTLRDIPDSEVFDALNQYRASHQVHQLVTDPHLCAYAAKRAQDLVAFGGLDHHEGFKRDFEGNAYPQQLEGYTGGGIGENLAHQHCYRGEKDVTAQTGAALIEWCFDSSTAGHKEAQLNPKYNAACVRHAQNMYVVIFGE